jgi:starvation-inducible DNA-binding protein
MDIRIGIKKEHLLPVATSLGKILADEFVLSTKTRKAHWNAEGSDFYSKHKMFEAQFSALDEIIDSLAERIRSLGHYAPGTLKEYLQLTHLTEQTREKNNSEGYIKDLLLDHESILLHLRENIDNYVTAFHDAGSSDYITGLMKTHEKFAWMLRSHLS